MQRWRGLDVIGGQLSVVISHDAIIAVMSHAEPYLDAVLPARVWEIETARASHRGELVILPLRGRYFVAASSVVTEAMALFATSSLMLSGGTRS